MQPRLRTAIIRLFSLGLVSVLLGGAGPARAAILLSDYGTRRPLKIMPIGDSIMVLVNSTSLRDPGTMFQPGDQVNFKPVKVARGYLATDVIPIIELEPEEGIEPERMGDFALGVLRHIDRQRYFGILELSDGRTALLHFSELGNPAEARPGITVKCQIEESVVRGLPRLEARDATIVGTTIVQPHRREGAPGDSLLERALLAREEGKYPEAAGIYEQAMSSTLSIKRPCR